MASSKPLFPSSFISSEAANVLPDGFIIRPLEKTDYAKGFIDCLRDLTWMGNPTQEEFDERYEEIDNGGKGPYYYLVIEHQGRVVGTGIVVAEKKFIHNRTTVGHIEEICISKQHQGTGLGRHMLNALNSVALNVGCAKTILNCSSEKVKFYEKCGYESSGVEMARKLTDQGTSP